MPNEEIEEKYPCDHRLCDADSLVEITMHNSCQSTEHEHTEEDAILGYLDFCGHHFNELARSLYDIECFEITRDERESRQRLPWEDRVEDEVEAPNYENSTEYPEGDSGSVAVLD